MKTDSQLLEELYDKIIDDIKNGMYGKYISVEKDGTFIVDDGIIKNKILKIENGKVYWFNQRTKYPGEWVESIPIISIKDRRHEQLYFKNTTTIPIFDNIFESPDYFNVAKGYTAKILYMTPMEYMKLVVIGFGNTTLEEELKVISKKYVQQYANDMLKGDLFPLINIEYHEDGSIDQEGRHRAMAIQYLIDEDKISKDTQIPVVIVEEV